MNAIAPRRCTPVNIYSILQSERLGHKGHTPITDTKHAAAEILFVDIRVGNSSDKARHMVDELTHPLPIT